MATNPREREDCWLCAGSGEIETRKADESYEDVTVGCPVCVQNDLEWERDNALREKEDLERQVASLTGALITEGRLLDPRDVAATAESHGLSIFKTANQRNNMGASAEGVLTDALNTILIGAICSPTTER